MYIHIIPEKHGISWNKYPTQYDLRDGAGGFCMIQRSLKDSERWPSFVACCVLVLTYTHVTIGHFENKLELTCIKPEKYGIEHMFEDWMVWKPRRATNPGPFRTCGSKNKEIKPFWAVEKAELGTFVRRTFF